MRPVVKTKTTLGAHMEAEGNTTGELVAALCYLKQDAIQLNAPHLAALIDMARLEAEALRTQRKEADAPSY
jgi:hypothetical protein